MSAHSWLQRSLLLLLFAACGPYPTNGGYQQALPPPPADPGEPAPPEPSVPSIQIPWPGNLTPSAPVDEGAQAACADLVGRTFVSERDLQGGISPAGPTTTRWIVRFDTSSYTFSYADMSEQGRYECQNGVIVGRGRIEHTGRYEPASKRLEWNGEMYAAAASGAPATPPPPQPPAMPRPPATPQHPAPPPQHPAPPPQPNARSSSVPRLAKSEQEARGCNTSADCVITCAVDGDCCRTSCGCRNALNRDFAKRLEADHEQSCRKRITCPVEGCAMETYSASCQQGLCVSRRGLGF